MSLKLKWMLFIAVDLALALVLVWLFLLREDFDQVEALREVGASLYPEPRAITAFRLNDQYGTAFTEADLAGRWSMVFFGFTNCPDVCPLTMAELEQFYRLLPENSGQPLPQVIMATVDPQRDNSEALGRYLERYHPDFVGLTGSDAALVELAEQLYVVRNTVTDAMADHGGMQHEAGSEHDNHGSGDMTAAEVPIDHSGHISVINPDGELYAVLRLPHLRERLLSAYQLILEHAQ